MSTHLDVGSVAANEGAHNSVGIFHGPVTVGHRDHSERLNKTLSDEIKTTLFLTDPYTDREGLDHENYQAWLRDDAPLLWISGGPGKGKTMMSIFLSEELEKFKTGTAVVQVFYYFCSHQDEKRNTGLTILRGLIWQMITQVPWLIKYVQPYFDTRERGMQTLSSLETLWIVFRGIITDRSLPRSYCVLDGLDECEEQTAKLLIIRLIEVLSKKHESASFNFRLVIVSRDILSLRSCKQIKLDPDNNDKVISDIQRFVEARVQDLCNIEGFNGDIRDLVTKTLLDRAEGTFLWVGFAVHELSQQNSCTQILETLEQIPPGLFAVYSRMLLHIPEKKREICSRLLRWITLASRPLSLNEVAAAIDVSPTSMVLDQKRRVLDELSICGPFVKVKGSAVELVHQSARDYLLRGQSDEDPVLETFRITPESAHLEIARACLNRVLEYVPQEPPRNDFGPAVNRESQEYPLMQYAISQASKHIEASSDLAITLVDLFQSIFIVPKDRRIIWAHTVVDGNSRHWLTLPTPLLSASAIGILPWIKPFTQRSFREPRLRKRLEMRDSNGRTSLHLAVNLGSVAVIKALLDRGADIDARDNNGKTVIHSAAASQSASLVDLLIGEGANIDLRADDGQTVLHAVASLQDERLVQLLLDKHANLEARTNRRLTPLHHAAWNGGARVVQLLVTNGADVEAVDTSGRTALHLAACQGHDDVIKVLVESGANIEARDEDGETALETAASAGHRSTVQRLIDAAEAQPEE